MFHIHFYNKPIISDYMSFNVRRIIYECRCGKKQCYEIGRPFDVPFPIPTTGLLSQKDFNEILNSNVKWVEMNHWLKIFNK